jgi:hypothetical protein
MLNAVELRTLLRRSDIRIDAGPANSIAVNTTLGWTQNTRLTLAASSGIAVAQPIVVEGHGAVTLTTGDTSPGALAFTGRGRLDFWDTASSLIVNGHTYVLANDVASLASAIAANTSGHFALARSYDASADALYTSSPIYVLYGSLNGLGHTISNVKIAAAQGCAGFIGYLVVGNGIPSAPAVTNLTLAQIDVTQKSNGDVRAPNGVGGLAGCSSGTISHVHVTGQVKGPEAVGAGGIVGFVAGLSQNGNVGGAWSPILDSSANAVVTGGTSTVSGGIAGHVLYGSIVRCASAGRVSGQDAGGLVGLAEWDFGNIVGSWSSARVIGPLSGGLVGRADGAFTLADNYATGAVSSGGGLIGGNTANNSYNGSSIQRSYALGVVHGGGVTGNDDGLGVYTSVYWDKDTTHVRNPANGVLNHPNYPGVAGLSDTQLKSGLPAGFDPSLWGQSTGINNGYPYLIANPPQ